jgi:two-component system chemotaxis sensor kinase CheA
MGHGPSAGGEGLMDSMERDRELLVETFLAESEENLAAMEEGLVALEGRSDDPQRVHEVFRAAHTLKGNAATFELSGVAALAHAMEDLLDRVRAGTLATSAALITLLLQAVDALREGLPAEMAGQTAPNPAHVALLKRLKQFGGRRSRARGERKAKTVDRAEDVAAAPEPASGSCGQGRRFEDVVGLDLRGRTLRVGIEKLDRLLTLGGELATARDRVRQALETLGPELASILELHRDADQLYADLQELVMEVRMVSVGPMFRRHARTLRDQAASHGKQVRLVLEGDDVEVDTKVIERISDPLTHMIRNALDHGIETPEQRSAKGKDPCGTVTLRARHETGSVVLEVADDGAGLDRERILERARARGLVGGGEELTDGQVQRLVLEPGFSTAETVTDLSGRGVGLDVVRRNVEALRGSLSIRSSPGAGTTVSARLPLTLAIIAGFGIGAGGEDYIVPLESVLETVELPREMGTGVESHGHGVMNLRGEALPCVNLRQLLGGKGQVSERQQVVVVCHEAGRAGLVVDALHGETQTVIKPLGGLFRGLPGIAGSSILGDGRVALILDVATLLMEAEGAALEGRAAEPAGMVS